jgi:poly-gamma-glutamate synthesis protein (capsule biosynthesis protein)
MTLPLGDNVDGEDKMRTWLGILFMASIFPSGPASAADTARDWNTHIAQLGEAAPDDITLLAGGDAIWTHKMSATKDPRATAMFTQMRAADISFLNFEQVMTDTGYPTIKEIVRADPSIIEEFTWAGVDVVSTANNHFMDYGQPGLERTLQILESKGIKHSGAGLNLAEALKPALIDKKGLKFALLSFMVAPNMEPRMATPAGPAAPGTAPIRGSRVRLADGRAVFAPWDEDLEAMQNAIREAKKTNEFVAVSMHIHWGDLEQVDAEGKQVLTRAAIDAGADIMLGHGPHVVNAVEMYKGKPIVYSMGNFAFQPVVSAYDLFPDSQRMITRLMKNERFYQAVMARLTVSPEGQLRRLELLPLSLTPEGDPHFVAGEQADVILNRVQDLSKPYGTTFKRVGWYSVVDLASGAPAP